MPRIKLSFAALNGERSERPIEDGEVITIVCMLKQWVKYTKGVKEPEIRFDEEKPDGFTASYILILADGRQIQMSRFTGQRTTKTRGRINASASEVEDVRTRVKELSMDTGEKMRQYFHRCGVERNAFDDDSIITATVRKAPVEDVDVVGFKDWYWLVKASSSKITPVAADLVTDDKKERVKRFAEQAHITVAPEEYAWWIAALGF
jgi:hypothetical protein